MQLYWTISTESLQNVHPCAGNVFVSSVVSNANLFWISTVDLNVDIYFEETIQNSTNALKSPSIFLSECKTLQLNIRDKTRQQNNRNIIYNKL